MFIICIFKIVIIIIIIIIIITLKDVLHCVQPLQKLQ